MTLYHFGNCVALVYVPYYMTYKLAGLSEYGAFWKCFQAGGIYMFTQLCKMLILATFFPDSADSLGSTGYTVFLYEFLRSSVDFADLLGLRLVLSCIPGKGHSKLITAGLGWAAAEAILTKGLLLWTGARGAEFQWTYMQKCLEGNLALVQHITTVTLVWLFSRHDLKKAFVPIITILLLLTAMRGLVIDSVIQAIIVGPWCVLLVRGLIAGAMGLITLQIYAGLAQNIGIF
ncbi:transmembrane protein 147-like [Ctenocephalides felis]|uniref:transmembrane protein 147-like n=1 Tax=Ctenocephalides felis TaxID=7515 RepID=UPI000E6E28C6|nr:transmembrane protein 147-like [Ctenocephalides felis]